MIKFNELQDPTGESDWTKPDPDTSPKCAICGENADRLMTYGINKWICDTCNTGGYLRKHKIIEEDWSIRAVGPYKS